MSAPILELRRLARTFIEGETEHTVLRGVDGAIQAGEVVVLVGPSGSGKSTLLNLVSGIDRPSAGSVVIAGTDITALSERDRTLFRRRHIGFVFQFFNLVPTLTVLENLLLPLELNGRLDDAGRAKAHALLAEVGLADRAGSWPDRLSGGERQRVAIARALVHDPDLLLADEPTGNLDEASGGHVLALLERLTRGAGKTMLVVTHSPDVVRLADRVWTLHDGRIATTSKAPPRFPETTDPARA